MSSSTNASDRPLAVVTGASSGIGLELAKLCAQAGHDLLVAADRPLAAAEAEFAGTGARIETVEADLATSEGVQRLVEATHGRPVAVLCANAGHGLGDAFLDQDFREVKHVIDTNITGTVELLQKIGRQMREQHEGRILVTGSVAGYQP